VYFFKKYSLLYWSVLLINIGAITSVKAQLYSFDFYDGTFNFSVDTLLQRNFSGQLSANHIKQYYQQLESAHSDDLIASLQNYRKQHQLNDWLYYQLIRKTAEQLSPKAKNYHSYTLYKWYLMVKSGYDARIAIGDNQIIFYVKCDEDISDIPYFMADGNKYMCLNYHDYQKLFKKADTYLPVKIDVAGAKNDFSY
jgi:hypothetical protein